jgi:hypothetical protein
MYRTMESCLKDGMITVQRPESVLTMKITEKNADKNKAVTTLFSDRKSDIRIPPAVIIFSDSVFDFHIRKSFNSGRADSNSYPPVRHPIFCVIYLRCFICKPFIQACNHLYSYMISMNGIPFDKPRQTKVFRRKSEICQEMQETLITSFLELMISLITSGTMLSLRTAA